MKFLLAPIIVFLSSLFLIGCVDSLDDVDEIETTEVTAEKHEIVPKISAPIGMAVSITTKLITINWNSVESATSYKVYISSEEMGLYSEHTTTNTQYSFSTNTVETYQIWVTAISENEGESNNSEVLSVVAKDKAILVVCNECSP
ncbi:MAG: hypothetical protein V7785_24805 [Bermanella sp.]